jgi:hypothetical protein
MDQRRNTNQNERFRRGVQVPQRPGVALRSSSPATPKQAPQPIIPLLDDKKPTSKVKRLTKLPALVKRHPKKSLLALCLLLILGYIIVTSAKKPPAVTVEGIGTAQKDSSQLPKNETPKFDTVLPAGKSIADYGGWTRISPDGRVPVYAYADKLNNVPIRVSQQELPENLSGNDEEAAKGVQELAEGFKANQKLTVGSTTVFIGNSAKGPQSVIFAKNELLILITSDQKIDNDHWTAYINSLQ